MRPHALTTTSAIGGVIGSRPSHPVPPSEDATSHRAEARVGASRTAPGFGERRQRPGSPRPRRRSLATGTDSSCAGQTPAIQTDPSTNGRSLPAPGRTEPYADGPPSPGRRAETKTGPPRIIPQIVPLQPAGPPARRPAGTRQRPPGRPVIVDAGPSLNWALGDSAVIEGALRLFCAGRAASARASLCLDLLLSLLVPARSRAAAALRHCHGHAGEAEHRHQQPAPAISAGRQPAPPRPLPARSSPPTGRPDRLAWRNRARSSASAAALA